MTTTMASAVAPYLTTDFIRQQRMSAPPPDHDEIIQRHMSAESTSHSIMSQSSMFEKLFQTGDSATAILLEQLIRTSGNPISTNSSTGPFVPPPQDMVIPATPSFNSETTALPPSFFTSMSMASLSNLFTTATTATAPSHVPVDIFKSSTSLLNATLPPDTNSRDWVPTETESRGIELDNMKSLFQSGAHHNPFSLGEVATAAAGGGGGNSLLGRMTQHLSTAPVFEALSALANSAVSSTATVPATRKVRNWEEEYESKLPPAISQPAPSNGPQPTRKARNWEDEYESKLPPAISQPSPSNGPDLASKDTVESYHDDESVTAASTQADEIVEEKSVVVGSNKTRRKRSRPNYDPEEKVYHEPTDRDVLLGRGGRTNHHPGNKRYLEAKEKIQPKYILADKNEKTVISLELVQQVQVWGGRFLELDTSTQRWFEVTEIKARKKASQTLREENTPESRAAKRNRYGH